MHFTILLSEPALRNWYFSVTEISNLPSRKSSKKSLSFSDHAYSANPKAEIPVEKKTIPHTSFTLDHDYPGSVRSGCGRLYNPVVKTISDLAKESKENDANILTANDIQEMFSAVKSGQVSRMAEASLKISCIKNAIIRNIGLEIHQSIEKLNRKKHLYVSELMQKTPSDLKTMNWSMIVEEFMKHFPELFYFLLMMGLPEKDAYSLTKIQKLIPRLGLIYGIIAQARNMELSRVQRVISMLLMDNICDQKVSPILYPFFQKKKKKKKKKEEEKQQMRLTCNTPIEVNVSTNC